MMNAGLVASSLLVARRGLLEGSLSERADYLFHETDRRDDPGTRSLQCGRRNDGMKVWAAWKYYGDEGYARRVEHLFELAGFAADRIEAESGLELLTRPESTNVCFRPIGTSAEALCREMERRKLAVITHGTYAGQSWVRLVCVDPDWSREDVGALLDDVVGVANELAS
jgi:glutamate/tyrosine decarboxylase-like PLP-dependent enzyme